MCLGLIYSFSISLVSHLTLSDNPYEFHPDFTPDQTHLDVYTLMKAWRALCQSSGLSCGEEDFVFPMVKDGAFVPSAQIGLDTFMKYVEMLATAGIEGRFSSHCFRFVSHQVYMYIST